MAGLFMNRSDNKDYIFWLYFQIFTFMVIHRGLTCSNSGRNTTGAWTQSVSLSLWPTLEINSTRSVGLLTTGKGGHARTATH